MKRYFLFAGDVYYPSGGWKDFKGAFDTIKDASDAAITDLEPYQKEELGRFNWYQVVDTSTWKIVEYL